MELNKEQKAIWEAANAIVEHECRRRKKWEDVLVRIAKSAFEMLYGVKQGDAINMRYITHEKVIYDDVCIDKYGDLKVRCYHLKNDGTPRKNASFERWGDFYDNEIKYKPEKED